MTVPTIHPLHKGGQWFLFPVIDITSVYDGDTLTAIIDLGFSVRTKRSVRIVGVDTPEVRGEQRPAGLIVRDYVRSIIPEGNGIYHYSHTDKDKYGRALGDIWLPDHGWLGEHLIANYMALRYMGGTRDDDGMEALCASIVAT